MSHSSFFHTTATAGVVVTKLAKQLASHCEGNDNNALVHSTQYSNATVHD